MIDQPITSTPADENQIVIERRAKLAQWRQAGQAYPNDFVPTHQCKQLQQDYGHLKIEDFEAKNIEVAIAGRMMLRRGMGKASFATLQDVSGRLQIYVNDKTTGADAHETFRHWDLGDVVGVSGHLFKTRTGELTVSVASLRLLSKCLRPLPEKFHGLSDMEARQRQRYLDLIINPDSLRTFQMRSMAVAELRAALLRRNFLEVETPMMHVIPGGATARPFATHHHSLNLDLFLRIAPELYLKRLVVGGLERVFELNRNFRNEGISPRHNPEFTMLEFYQAYSHHRGMMDLTEALLREVVEKVHGKSTLHYQGRELDFAKPFPRLSMLAALEQHGFGKNQLGDISFLRKTLQEAGSAPEGNPSLATLQLSLFEEKVEATLHEPVFITDYPVEVSPLARASTDNPAIAERFELFIAGREIANGFSELNDPEDQAARLRAQATHKSAGDLHAMYYDADYVHALEYALPPTGGCGIGVDRLLMLLADKANIRDVILFPLLRPAGAENNESRL